MAEGEGITEEQKKVNTANKLKEVNDNMIKFFQCFTNNNIDISSIKTEIDDAISAIDTDTFADQLDEQFIDRGNQTKISSKLEILVKYKDFLEKILIQQ